jgi:transposase
VRATTAFNKMLAIPGADVAGVTFTPTGIVVALRRRGRRLHCPCGWSTRAVYDRSTRRWRHLDLGAARLFLQAEIRRLACRGCGRVRTETVPWARPGARFTRDFEDTVAYLAQRTDKTTITRLLRCSWEAVAAVVVRVVAGHLDDGRLDELYRIGIDEVSYRKGHRYLTVVADHDREGAVVWAGEGKSGATLERFFDQLGPDRTARLTAASMDLHGAYAKVTATHAPQARVCADPFHVVKLANTAWTRSAAPPGTPPAAPQGSCAGPAVASGPTPPPTWSSTPAGRCSKTPPRLPTSSRRPLTGCAAPATCCFAPGRSKKSSATCTGSRKAAAPTPTWTPGWPAPAAVASRPWSRCPRPSAATATRSWPPSTWACPTASWKASTPRSG